LKKEIQEGRFREDLYYRINVVRVDIPPLRERPEDIPELLDFFLQRFRQEVSKPQLRYSEGVLEKLQRYAWPGNIRELRNAVERAVVLCTSRQLSEKEFPFLETREPVSGDETLFVPDSLQNAVNRFKKEYIARILEQTGGNQSRAAQVLAIQRTYLNRLIKELGISLGK
jgi:Nif-specific regulatory protein